MEIDHFIKYGGHSYCSNRDIIFSACHVIKPDHVIKESSNYMIEAPQGKSPPCQVWWSQAL